MSSRQSIFHFLQHVEQYQLNWPNIDSLFTACPDSTPPRIHMYPNLPGGVRAGREKTLTHVGHKDLRIIVSASHGAQKFEDYRAHTSARKLDESRHLRGYMVGYCSQVALSPYPEAAAGRFDSHVCVQFLPIVHDWVCNSHSRESMMMVHLSH